METTAAPQTHKVRLRWAFGLIGLGLVITVLAFVTPFVPSLGENAVAVWQSILTNFGVGLISAAVLLLFEPRFRKVVTDSVTTATAGVKAEVREAVQADIDERLAPLTERIDSLYDAKLAEHPALITDLANDFTHERVAQTLRKADEVAALSARSLRVQAEDVPGKLHISLQLRPFYRPDAWQRVQHHGSAEEPEEELVVAAYTEGGKHASVTWEATEDFATVAIDLATELNRQRARGLAQRIDWKPVMTRFEKGVKAALDASHRAPGALAVDGALVEMAGPDSAPWFLTTDGLYNPSQGWSLHRKFFVVHRRGHGNESRNFPDLDRPSWADPTEWEYMVSRARANYDIW